MPDQTQNKNRKSTRLKDFDYSTPGDYFITICTHEMRCIFGEVVNCEMVLNEVGKIVKEEILKTEKIRSNVKIDVFTIMPNHLHMVLSILCNEDDRDRRGDSVNRPDSRATQRVAPTASPTLKPNTISSIIGQIKSITSKRAGTNLWQRSYYDHIITNERSYSEIYDYIISNPSKWEEDRNHPSRMLRMTGHPKNIKQ